MPINVNTMWVSVQNLVNVWRTGFVTPSRFNDYLQQSSIDLFNKKRDDALANDIIDDDLAPFLKSENLPVTAPQGVNWGLVIRPESEYNYFIRMRAFFSGATDALQSCGCPTSDNSACDASKNLAQPLPTPTELIPIVKEVRVTKVSSGEWDSVLNHRKKFPTLDRPYTTQFSDGFKIAPRDLKIVTLDNYRLPKTAVFGYTQLPSGYFQYDASSSVNIEWGAQVYDQLLDRILKLCGVQLKNPPLFQMADNLKATR